MLLSSSILFVWQNAQPQVNPTPLHACPPAAARGQRNSRNQADHILSRCDLKAQTDRLSGELLHPKTFSPSPLHPHSFSSQRYPGQMAADSSEAPQPPSTSLASAPAATPFPSCPTMTEVSAPQPACSDPSPRPLPAWQTEPSSLLTHEFHHRHHPFQPHANTLHNFTSLKETFDLTFGFSHLPVPFSPSR